jgi:hypothetical protein
MVLVCYPFAIMDKDRVDALLRLADASWRAFDRRSSYEWKVCFALWSSLSLFSGLMLKGDVHVARWPNVERALIICLAIAIWVDYVFVWTRALYKRNQQDKFRADLNWMRVEEEIGIRDSQRKLYPPDDKWLNWSHGSQILITTLFLILAIFAVFAAT